MSGDGKIKPCWVLIVDDDPNVLEGFRRGLQGFSLETAGNGRDALTLVNNREYAVIVSDLSMPMMDGLTFLERTREVSPYSTRVVVTGDADLEKALDAVNRGNVFQFLQKPCSSDMLAQTIRAGVEQFNLVSDKMKLESENRVLKARLTKAEELAGQLQRQLQQQRS